MAASIRHLDNLSYYSIRDDEIHEAARSDLENTIDQAEQQLQSLHSDAPEYTKCLKTLIVSLIKKFRLTMILEDLQRAVFRAQEMVIATPEDHPERAIRIKEWIDLMHVKLRFAGSTDDDLRDLIYNAEQVGASVRVIPGTNGNGLRVDLPM